MRVAGADPQLPARGRVRAVVAEQVGPGGHALPEVVREALEDPGRDPERPQAVVGERDVDRGLGLAPAPVQAHRGRDLVDVLAQPPPPRLGVGHPQDHEERVVEAVAGQDVALDVPLLDQREGHQAAARKPRKR